MKIFQFNIMLSLFAVPSLFSECAMVGPDFEKPESLFPEKWKDSTSAFKETNEEENLLWWTQFNDLVKTAYEQNLSLIVAGLRILEARARLDLAERQCIPTTPTGNVIYLQ